MAMCGVWSWGRGMIMGDGNVKERELESYLEVIGWGGGVNHS